MYFGPIFDLFYPRPPKPTFDLFLTYFNVFWVSGPLGRLLLHKARGRGQFMKTWGFLSRGLAISEGLPVSPYPLNLRGESSPPKFKGRPSKNTISTGLQGILQKIHTWVYEDFGPFSSFFFFGLRAPRSKIKHMVTMIWFHLSFGHCPFCFPGGMRVTNIFVSRWQNNNENLDTRAHKKKATPPSTGGV